MKAFVEVVFLRPYGNPLSFYISGDENQPHASGAGASSRARQPPNGHG